MNEMEKKIEMFVPRNDYKQPTEVREDVLKQIITALLSNMEKEVPIVINTHNKGIYLRRGNLCYDRFSNVEARVHGVEMNAAFRALHKAGYYLYTSYDIVNDRMTYVWSRKPKYGRQEPMKEPNFNTFID